MAPGDAQSAFAQAAAEDGIVLGSQSFDWLCEQGHVGLERVAKARRDPALVGPVTAALEPLARDLRSPRGRRLGPARVAREPAAPCRSGARADRNRDRGRRVASLHLVPPGRPRALSGRCDGGVRPRRAQGAVPRLVLEDRRPRARPRRQGLRLRRACSGSGRTTMRCVDLATPAMGHPPVVRIAAVDGDGAAAYRRHRASLLALLGSWTGRRFVPVDHRDVDRRAPPAADADLLRHLHRVHRRGEDVAALDADVVVRAVAVEDGPVGVLLDRGPAVARHLAGAYLSHRDRRHRRPTLRARRACRLKSLISASSTPTTTPSPIDAALPVICAFVWIVPPPSVSANDDVGVRVSLAAGLLGLDAHHRRDGPRRPARRSRRCR